jgi:chromate transporter
MHRTLGGLVAGGLFVLPSLFILIALSWVYVRFGNLPVVAGIFFGLKPAVTALVLHAGWSISTRALRNPWLWCIAAASFVAIFALDVPFPAIVLGAAAIGWLGAKRWPSVFVLGGAHAAQRHYGPAFIDDDTPPPPHVRFTKRRALLVLLVGAALWGFAFVAVSAAFGAESTLAAMSWFFTKAALVTFGGAYAVLPYVYQGAVETHQWLSGPQMIDGLALGETTPGPLIMVVAFVGFLGGWFQEVAGTNALLLGGVLGAAVATFFTFLPSFVFIFAGGPLVEATHGDLRFTAPLSAITAAVVGVIVNLALFFAWHVFWPSGLQREFDWAAALIAAGAAVALFRFRVGVVPLLAACGALGLGVTLLR